MQVLLGVIARPPKTSMVRRAWNLTHWTVGRAVLALAIADIFIGFYLSNVAHKHIIAQAVVLGGLFIIYMLKNDIEYLLVRISPAEEDRLLVIAQQPGTVCTHRHQRWIHCLDLHAFGCCVAVLHIHHMDMHVVSMSIFYTSLHLIVHMQAASSSMLSWGMYMVNLMATQMAMQRATRLHQHRTVSTQ